MVLDHATRSKALVLALIGVAVLAVAVVVLVSVVRSDGLARRLGGWLDALATRIWTLFRKTPPSGIVEAMLELGESAKAMLTRRGVVAFAAAVVARLAWFVVLEVALWSVGVGPELLPPATVLAAMAVVGMVSLPPITPGAVGVAEVAYIGILSSVAGPGSADSSRPQCRCSGSPSGWHRSRSAGCSDPDAARPLGRSAGEVGVAVPSLDVTGLLMTRA